MSRAEKILQAANRQNRFDVYEAIHSAAATIKPIDAFYLCLYDPGSHLLRYVYDAEEVVDAPGTWPLGDGPTSWAVRNKRTLSFVDGVCEEISFWVHFGEESRVTRSGLHIPVLTPQEQVVAVLSVQWYTDRGWTDDDRAVFEWLALRCYDLLGREEGISAEEATARELAVNQWWVSRIYQFCRRSSTHPESESPALVKELRQLMIESMMPKESINPTGDSGFALAIKSLTRRELEVAEQAARGMNLAAIADALFISKETVKTHLGRARKKLATCNMPLGVLSGLLSKAAATPDETSGDKKSSSG